MSQSQATYATVKGALEATDAPYASRAFTSFLQGSYGNDTNIYADSDVDVVMRLESTFYRDLSSLTPGDTAAYHAANSSADYSYDQFKADVIAQLTKKFGSAVKPGKKAVLIEGNGSRRDADVVPAAEYRKYRSFSSVSLQDYVEGICFWTGDQVQVINYPKQHSANATAKHQASSGRFKPMVRIVKNMRNRMAADGLIVDGLAPSYFIEGMLYNVPNGMFVSSLGATFVDALNWLLATDRSQLVCANEQYYLLNDTSPVTWRAEKCTLFLAKLVEFWNGW